MKMMTMTVAALLAAGGLCYAADNAGDPLDGALGGKPAMDPNAAAKHDNDDLTNDLTSGKKEEPAKVDPGKMMQDFIDHTGAAGDNLKDKQDPGAETQDHQRRATVAMDAMIEYVKEQQKKQQQQQQQPSPPKPGEKKQQNPGQPGDKPGDKPGEHQDGGTNAAQNSELPGGGVNPFQANGEMISKDPKEWGNLPPKDRDVMLNSLMEGSMKSYQEKIRKYYESLAEIGRGNK